MMKTGVVVAAMAARIATAQDQTEKPLEGCLFCRYTDLQATLLESYSYCRDSQECLADEWNYIDRPCVD